MRTSSVAAHEKPRTETLAFAKGLRRLPSSVLRTALERQLHSGLQQRLETAEDLVPAASRAFRLTLARYQRRELRCARDVVRHRELRDAASGLLDLIREAREPLRGQPRIHQHAPGLHELAWRVRLDDLPIDDDIRNARELLHPLVWIRLELAPRPVGRTRPAERSRTSS